MSYLKRVEKQKGVNRAVEERRKDAKVPAMMEGGYGRVRAFTRSQPAPVISEAEPLPTPDPAYPKCKRWILVRDIVFLGRCGFDRGHDGGCVRSESLTRAEILARREETLKAKEELRAAQELVKAEGAKAEGEVGR